MLKSRACAGGAGIRWQRTIAIAITILFICYWLYSTWRNYVDPPGVDFVSFWAAGRLALIGQPELIYDMVVHRQMEATSGGVPEGWMPFANPPPYLFFVIPFALLSFWAAFSLWVALTAALFFAAFRRLVPLPFTFAHPAALTNALIGQNGFLTSAIFMFGTSILEKRAFTGGLILGLLVIKPQLAVLIPVALLAARMWKALAGGAAGSIGVLALGAACFGLTTYSAMVEALSRQAGFANGRIPWPELASVFAMSRAVGLSATPSLVLHAVIALLAATVTWVAWSRRWPTRVPILAAATMLMSPYILTYDSLLLMLPIGWLMREDRQPRMVALLWFLCLTPFLHFWDVYSGPTLIPVAAILALYLMVQLERRGGIVEKDDHAVASVIAA